MPTLCVALPPTDYQTALALQKKIVEAKKQGRLGEDVILLLEHLPVFTLGRRGGLENLVVSESFLSEKKIAVVHVERGGDITYHGPGQLVGYPIMDIKRRKLGVAAFVTHLEEVMIRTAGSWNVDANRDPRNRGAWVQNNKLGSIGIAVTRGVSFHGFAFNVCADLEPFQWINPCGLRGVGVTSLSRETQTDIRFAQVVETAKQHFAEVFGVALVETPAEDLALRL